MRPVKLARDGKHVLVHWHRSIPVVCSGLPPSVWKAGFSFAFNLISKWEVRPLSFPVRTSPMNATGNELVLSSRERAIVSTLAEAFGFSEAEARTRLSANHLLFQDDLMPDSKMPEP